MSDDRIEWITHAKVRLALHALRPARADAAAGARPLLLLHGLGECSPGHLDTVHEAWPGPIHGLDFTGHGRSDVPRGGGYTAEVLMGDADAALARLGPLTVCGRGLGAYIALLIAGARAREVWGAILCDGPGLAGGGAHPASPHVIHADPSARGAPDAFALAELAQDLRPADYATAYVRQAEQFAPIDHPIAVCARNRPSWLNAVREASDVEVEPLASALERFARAEPAFD
jgi:pimeloyl-ACP methyl ester carboxylesterase